MSGGSFDEINGHCFLTVIRAVFNINNQSTVSVISLWLSEALLPRAPPFSFHVFTFEGCFRALPESTEKLRLFLHLLSPRKWPNSYEWGHTF